MANLSNVSSFSVLVVLLSFLLRHVSCLDNGLANAPPMGWLAWERFRCNTDCVNDPHNCISERLFRQMADLLVSDGYHDAGYTYINIDDCWLDHQRDKYGQLQPDKERFPSGIKALSDYVHSLGLKFGIYEDYGNFTCAGYPGIMGHLETDANTFASWDVDYVKLDGCYSLPTDMDVGYPEFGYWLNKTGRPMIYACSWPVYQTYSGMTPDYEKIISSCNLWRNFDDIQDSWQSVASVIDYYGDNQDTIIPNAGPGHWNDPDMLIVGNFGLSYEQSKTQMAMWAIFAAPLLMSVDLRTLKPDYKAILQNKKIIAVNQDRLGIQGRRIYKQKGIEIWARPIMPVQKGKYSYGIVFLNRRTDGTPSEVSVTLKELGLDHVTGYHITDLYDDYDYGIVTPERRFKVDVNPSGSVVMIRADLYKGSKRLSNFIDRDAAPRKDDSGLIVDHGNVGFIPNADGHHPLGGRFSFPSFPAQGYGYTPAYDQRDHGYSPQGIYGGHAAAGTARPYQQGKKK
jgi:alpha-N-acetylgalactosaminidase